MRITHVHMVSGSNLYELEREINETIKDLYRHSLTDRGGTEIVDIKITATGLLYFATIIYGEK